MSAVTSRRPLTMAVITDGRPVGVLRRGWSGARPVHGSACRCGDFSAYDVTTFGDAARQFREHLQRCHGLDVTGLDLGTWPFRTTADNKSIAEALRELVDAWEGCSITSEIGAA